MWGNGPNWDITLLDTTLWTKKRTSKSYESHGHVGSFVGTAKLWTAASEVPGKIQRTYIEKNHFTLSVATSMKFIATCICIGQPVLVITRYVSIDKSESSCARQYSLGNVAWALGYPALVTDIMFIMSAGLLDICRRRISSK
ncbi:hypothetical protein C8J56DRAFT_888277 [Mycena floridula]|nr:hypothetical protein C8J56DRAFT_888277 [Mycena floridula]